MQHERLRIVDGMTFDDLSDDTEQDRLTQLFMQETGMSPEELRGVEMEQTKNPTQWLTDLLAEVELFDPAAFPPREQKLKDESSIGTCPEELRKLFAFGQYCEREIAQAKLDMKFASRDDLDEISTRIGIFNMKQEVCQDVFIGCLTEYFSDWEKEGHLHVREGWEVVRCKKCSRSGSAGPFDLLRGLGFSIGPNE